MLSSLAQARAVSLVWGSARQRSGTSALPPFDCARADDRELASLATQSREAAFRKLLSRYERPVFSLVYRMVRDCATAEDLAQEAFIRAFNTIDSYNPAYRFSNWIFKIANNYTIDHLQHRKLNTVSIEGSPHATSAQEERATRRITVEVEAAFGSVAVRWVS